MQFNLNKTRLGLPSLGRKILPTFVADVIYRLRIAKKYKVVILRDVELDRSTRLEGNNAIGEGTKIIESSLGLCTYVANHSTIIRAKIGRYCAIGDNVRTFLGIHPTSGFVSIHPLFFSQQKQVGFTFVDRQKFAEHRFLDVDHKFVVEIGNDVWIGNNVLILDGIRIADGAVVAAGSIVTKDVDPYSIVAGVPAKKLRKRFREEDIAFLLNLRWWDREFDWIRKNAHLFEHIDLLRTAGLR